MAAKDLVHNGFLYRPLFNDPPDELLEKAKREINETEETIAEGKKVLKELLKEKNLPFGDDEKMLMLALRIKKFKHKASFDFMRHSQIKSFVFLKEHYGKERYLNMDLLRKLYHSGVFAFLPYRDKDGSIICYFKAGLWMEMGLPFDEVFHGVTFFALFTMEMPATQLTGITFILDLQDFSVKEIPYLIQGSKIAVSHVKANPTRVKKVLFIRTSRLYESILHFVSRLLPQKARMRYMILNGNLSSLHKVIGPEILPEELGGTLGPIKDSPWLDKLEEVRNRVLHVWNVMESHELI